MFTCAIDLGASGGRMAVCELKSGKLSLTEIHRFLNEPVNMYGGLYWDTPRLFHEIKTGLKKAAAEKIPLSGIGIDTWGVDYGLLDARSNLIGLPLHYRDKRLNNYPGSSYIPLDELYNSTGIQFMCFNTVFQLMADYEMRPEVLAAADSLLFMPDLFTFYLTGKKINEYTIASTSQLINPHTADWDHGILNQLKPGNLGRLFAPITYPSTVIGPLCSDILEETGINPDVKVIAVGSHDTASAVAGTPIEDSQKAAFLSSGTWSLLGMEREGPLVNADSRDMNFTNEGGLGGSIRFLKNINGLFLMQMLRKSFNDKETVKMDFPDMIKEAKQAERKHFTIKPNDPAFLNPPDMDMAVREYCKQTGQGEPRGKGEVILAVYNGLADEYANTLKELETINGAPFDKLHIVGGGVQDTFLCGLTAKAIGKEVVAGPVEATTLGNIVAQLIALGAIENLKDGRSLIKDSYNPIVY